MKQSQTFAILAFLILFIYVRQIHADCIAKDVTTLGAPTAISSLDCQSIMVTNYPYSPDWGSNQSLSLRDSAGMATGFTMMLPCNSGKEYDPTLLKVQNDGILSMTTSSGLFNTKNLGNALGVGLMTYSRVVISASVDLPPVTRWIGQGGMWVGMKETDYIKITSLSPNNGLPHQIESKLEINGARVNEIKITVPSTTRKITFWMELDPTQLSIATYYSLDGSSDKFLAWIHDKIPSEWFGLGNSLVSDELGTQCFGGIYASRVTSGTSSVYNFTSFSVDQVTSGEGCYTPNSPFLPYGLPLSTLPCSEVGNAVDTSRFLDFVEDSGGIKDQNGVGTGLTMSLPSEDGNSIIRYDLKVEGGFLKYSPTVSIPQGNVYELNNALGVGISPRVPQVFRVKISRPTAGTGNYEQAGIGIGVSQKSCVKFLLMSESRNSDFFTLRVNYRVDGVVLSQFNIANFMRGAGEGYAGTDLTMSFITDPAASTITARYNDTVWRTFEVPTEWFSAPADTEVGTNLFGHIAASIKFRKSPYEIRFSEFAVTNV